MGGATYFIADCSQDFVWLYLILMKVENSKKLRATIKSIYIKIWGNLRVF